jgi:hypothetical protein
MEDALHCIGGKDWAKRATDSEHLHPTPAFFFFSLFFFLFFSPE